MPPYTGGSQAGGAWDARNQGSDPVGLHPVSAADTA